VSRCVNRLLIVELTGPSTPTVSLVTHFDGLSPTEWPAIGVIKVDDRLNHFSDGPVVVGCLTLCKIDSSEWHDRSSLLY
jgi:hypothetical protein